MKIIKMLCKVLMFPFVLSLILFTAMMKFLFSVGLFLLTAASVVFVVLGIAVFFTPTPLGGAGVLFLAFLLSPFGLFFVKHFSLKKASKFPVFIKGFSLLSAGNVYDSLRISACSIR